MGSERSAPGPLPSLTVVATGGLTVPSNRAAATGIEPAAATRPIAAAKVASIAMRTWIYNEPDDESTRLGYLRAGAVLERSGASVGTRGCAGGWYRIRPRGHVCVGKGATLDLDNPVVLTAFRGPRRGNPSPYRYVISRQPPPHLYFRLASEKQQTHAEGKRRARSMALFSAKQLDALGPPDPIPEFLRSGGVLPKPYGATKSLHYQAHRGRANEESAFGLIATFEWTERRFGLTTELDLIPLDRTRLANPSKLAGIEVKGAGIPAFVVHHEVGRYRPDSTGRLRQRGTVSYRSGWVLTGRNNGSPRGLLETTTGIWLPFAGLRIARLREDPAGFSREGRKWIDVSIRQQLLVAYEGTRPVYATLVSTGRGGMDDPQETHATIRGTFMIHAKHLTGTMDGDEATDEAYDLRDVPYIQYFHQGYALHGAYWHDKFGRLRSHGCINLPPAAAAWLFEWTEPQVPEKWHAALNPNAGTLVYIHG